MRKSDKLAIDPFLAANEMPLDFNENIFAAESVDQKLRAICERLGSTRVSRVGEGVLAIANFLF